MALLRNPHTGQRIMLRTLHAFGRHPIACRTVLPCPDVSQIHALLRWNQHRWEILDQSRNGTFADEQRLPSGTWLPLAEGCELAMGEAPEAQWSVADLAPPADCLLPLRGDAPPLALRPQGMFVPSVSQPEVHVHCQDNRSWMLEDLRGVSPLEDGAIVHTSAMDWEVVLCPDLTSTQDTRRHPAAARGPEATLHFELSQDEEHARLRVEIGGRCIDLGERIHHYSLATLARLRLRDAERGLDSHAQGWVSIAELARMLGVDPSYVNIQIFRARHQLANALPQGTEAPLLIERRRGEVRLGDYGFSVHRGLALEGLHSR
jgi:hypothetical protein